MEKKTKAVEEQWGRLLAASILSFPNRAGHLIVDEDIRYEKIGFCLQQRQPDG